jgi:putative hemolysin
MTIGNILLILVLIVLNGFFVGIEYSAVSGRRSRLDIVADEDNPYLETVRTWFEQPAARERLIAACQLGITFVSLALGAVGENAFEAWLEPLFESILLPQQLTFLRHAITALPLILSLLVITSLLVVLGELVPKVAVLRFPERFALIGAPVMTVFAFTFRYFIDMLDWATQFILRLLGLPAGGGHSNVLSPEEFKLMVNGPEAEHIEPSEREMISAIIGLGDMSVRQVRVPRVNIIAVDADSPVEEIMRVATENGRTKLPVFEDTLESIIGIVHVLDVLEALQKEDGYQNITARDLAREAIYVPESSSAINLFLQLQNHRTSIAIVLDEFGGTGGLVTFEDLLEEIIGDVQDQFDIETPPIHMLADGSALIDGMTLIEDVNEYFSLDLEDPFYNTIAGYILGKMETIPELGAVVEVEEQGICLTVNEMERHRIARVYMTRR